MATLGSVLLSNVMGHSKAEQAFRPWWDNFEDFLAYGLVMLGKNFDSIEFEIFEKLCACINLVGLTLGFFAKSI